MPSHIHKSSTRNAKGRRWHGRGYREHGHLYIQLHRSFAKYSRYHSVNENATITDLINSMHDDLERDDCVMPPDIHVEFFCKRKRLEESDDMVKTILDGGETVYAKAFDLEGNLVREILW